VLRLQIREIMGSPIYGKIANAVCGEVVSGRIAPGDRLPTESALAEQLGVNRLTVSRAYDDLQKRGIVVKRRRLGTHVAADAKRNVRRSGNRRIDAVAVVAGTKSLAEKRREYMFIWDDIFGGLREELGEGSARISFLDSFTSQDIGLTQYDGIVLLHPKECDAALLAKIQQRGIPVVSMWEPRLSVTIPHVDYDRHHSAALACRHLVDCGYRRIGFLGSQIFGHRMRVSLKYAVFASLLQTCGLDICARYVRHVDWHPGKAYAATREIIETGDLPEAFFVDSDHKAMEVVCALNDAGLKVPEDVGIVSYDDNPESATFHPPLTTVRVPRREMGQRVAQLLLDWPSDGSVPQDVVLEAELIVRGSTLNRRE